MFLEIERNAYLEMLRVSDGVRGRELFQQTLKRARVPRNQRNEEITAPGMADDLVDVEFARPVGDVPDHSCADRAAQAKSGEQYRGQILVNDKRQPFEKYRGQRAKCRQGQNGVAYAVCVKCGGPTRLIEIHIISCIAFFCRLPGVDRDSESSIVSSPARTSSTDIMSIAVAET